MKLEGTACRRNRRVGVEVWERAEREREKERARQRKRKRASERERERERRRKQDIWDEVGFLVCGEKMTLQYEKGRRLRIEMDDGPING